MFFDPYGIRRGNFACLSHGKARYCYLNIAVNDHLYATATVSMDGYYPQQFTGRLDSDTNKMMYESGILDACVKQSTDAWTKAEAVEKSNCLE
jgi:hypothetical protein